VDRAEAQALADERLDQLRKLTWSALRQRFLDRQETEEVTGASGAWYQLETQAVWDDQSIEDGDLRVSIDVNDGRNDLIRDFIIAPDGSFVGSE
jgi:hypothetical protein